MYVVGGSLDVCGVAAEKSDFSQTTAERTDTTDCMSAFSMWNDYGSGLSERPNLTKNCQQLCWLD